MSLWGIDISNHQPGADLAKAKAAGCSFVFAKATEGATYADPYFAGFRAKAASLGLPLGAYHFARPQPGRTGAQEAGAFLHVVGDVKAGELPCVLDLEDTKLPAKSTTAWALDWLRTVHRATGVRPILYTYSAFAAASLFPSAELATYPLWLANYRTSAPPAPKPWDQWLFWQHSSTSRVPGIPGYCDRNITNLTPAQLIALGNTQEDDMFTDADRALLQQVLTKADGATIRADIGHVRDQLRGDLSTLSAQQLADSIPDNLAQQVVDLLATRLKGA